MIAMVGPNAASARGGSWAAPPSPLLLCGADLTPQVRRSGDGFTLIEIVVALAILGIGVTLALQLFSGALKRVRVNGLHVNALTHAERLMNEFLVDETINRPGEFRGAFEDGFRWRARLEEMPEDPDAAPLDMAQPPPPTKLMRIVVEVSWDEKNKENSLGLETIKIMQNDRLVVGAQPRPF